MAYTIVALLFIALLAVLHKKGVKQWFVILPVALIGACCLALSAIGQWLGGILTDIAAVFPVGLINSIFGASIAVTSLFSVIAALLLLVVILDVKDKSADKPAQICIFAMPMTMTLAGGAVATLGASLVGFVAQAGTSLGAAMGL